MLCRVSPWEIYEVKAKNVHIAFPLRQALKKVSWLNWLNFDEIGRIKKWSLPLSFIENYHLPNDQNEW